MNTEIIMRKDGRKTRYRPVVIAHNWAKSKFEYYHEGLKEWRTVINWNNREKLFNIATQRQGELF